MNAKGLEKIKKDILDAMNNKQTDIVTRQTLFSIQSVVDELLKFNRNEKMDRKRIEIEFKNLQSKLNIMYGIDIFDL